MKSVLPLLQTTIDTLIDEFDRISLDRKAIIMQLVQFIQSKTRGDQVLLNFICTHNSRRSHIAQIWAQTAAWYYGIQNVIAYSGGTEATAFNPKAVKAMRDAGFDITIKENSANPTYEVRFSEGAATLLAFSKKYDDISNPEKDFAAIMTCSHADENCPLISGSAARIALTYDDPKDFDNTPFETAKYTERVHQIGREILFAFYMVSKENNSL